MLKPLRRIFRSRQKVTGREPPNSTDGTADQASAQKKVKHFPAGIKTLHSSPSNSIDLVFIHGLTGDRERTWSYGDAKPWPALLLPTALPEARVLTFGYDAYVTDLGGMVSRNRISNHAMNLITSLATYRGKDDTNTRPIIFVCHSLGGLVCQDAVLQARLRPEQHLREIYDSCRDILFLGTPHRGSGFAKWGEMLARVIGLVKQTNSHLLKALMRDSKFLEAVQDSFSTMIRARQQDGSPTIEMTCFYEELPLPGVGQVVPRESAALPGYTPISIRQNHMNMTKFADEEDPGFQSVLGELRRWTDVLSKSSLVPKQPDSPRSLTVSEKEFLSVVGPRRYIDIKERVEGTCTWSTSTIQFRSWQQSRQSSVLWITGPAGTGKTTLASYLVDHLTKSAEHAVCSFFCSRDIDGQHDISSLLQDLILQLTMLNKKALRQAKSASGVSKHSHKWSFELLWRMFENVLALFPGACVYVAIDALDECEEELKSRLLHKFARALTTPSNSDSTTLHQVKLVISGQPQVRGLWSGIESYDKHYHIDIENSSTIRNDLLLFIDRKVADIVGKSVCSHSVGKYLKEVLSSKAENSFLWLEIILKHVKSSLRYHKRDIQDILSEAPQNLQQA